MKSIKWLPLLLVASVFFTGCGFFRSLFGGKDKSDSVDQSETEYPDGNAAGLTVPDYVTIAAGADTPDLSSISATVQTWQTRGQLIAQIAADNGKITLDDGTVVALTNISKNACPADLANCTESDSVKLGIGDNAMVADLDFLVDRVRNQGDRGTCVSFTLSGAAEILANREGIAIDVSEQNTYFVAKKVTGTWTSSGLEPVSTLDNLIRTGEALVAEEHWPYNNDEACEDYLEEHPGFTCSETEAQGGGSDGKTQEPKAAAAPRFRIDQAHQLYASLGRVKQALYQGYPVLIGVNANIDLNIAAKKKGVVSWVFKVPNCGESVCGHAMLAVGYQDDAEVEGGGYLIVRNSWGASWGADGIAYLTYKWVENSLLDAQAIVKLKVIE